MLSSAGMLSILEGLGQEKAQYIYRLFLAIVDGLNVLIIYWILKNLSVKKAAYWAGIIGLSISVWAGGALWIQIDGISQFFLLLTLAWIVWGNTGRLLTRSKYWQFLTVSGFLLGITLLTKQLTIFSAFPLGVLLATSIIFHARKWKYIILDAMLALGAFLVSIFCIDLTLHLKQPYTSHLYYIWQEGSSHSNVISGNGFNIWMFLGRDMWSSSHTPYFPYLEFLTPYGVGIFLFMFFAGIISLSLALFLKEHFNRGEQTINSEILLNGIFYLALVNLCFNLFLTGTHERYLYHFYPYILMAVVGLASYNRIFSKKLIEVHVLGANLYGVFILQIMSSIDFNIGYLSHWIMGIFHLGLFIWLFIIQVKYQDLRGNLIAIFEKNTKNLPTVR